MLLPTSSSSTNCITVSMILLSTITSFTEEARAIIATAGSMLTAPFANIPSTVKSLPETIQPDIRPVIKKLAARMGMANPEISRIHATATRSTP